MENSRNVQKGFYMTAVVAAVIFICLIILDVTASIIAGKVLLPALYHQQTFLACSNQTHFGGFSTWGC